MPFEHDYIKQGINGKQIGVKPIKINSRPRNSIKASSSMLSGHQRYIPPKPESNLFSAISLTSNTLGAKGNKGKTQQHYRVDITRQTGMRAKSPQSPNF